MVCSPCPQLGRVFATATGTNEVAVIDEQSRGDRSNSERRGFQYRHRYDDKRAHGNARARRRGRQRPIRSGDASHRHQRPHVCVVAVDQRTRRVYFPVLDADGPKMICHATQLIQNGHRDITGRCLGTGRLSLPASSRRPHDRAATIGIYAYPIRRELAVRARSPTTWPRAPVSAAGR